MAETKTNKTQAPENPNKGATFVKWGLLAKPLLAPIAAVRPGNFGKTDIEVHANGRRFIVSLGPTNPQYAALIAAFGRPEEWVGNSIQIGDDSTVKQINVVPISRKDGTPIAR
jgi:hypothetical protein